MNQKQTAAAAVTMLSEYFRQPLTDAAVEAYLIGLDELTTEALQMVTKRAIRECRFMPAASELLAFAGKGGKLALTSAMAEAWEAVRGAIRAHGYTTGVDFGPLVNAVVRNLGGWVVLNDKTTDEMVWVRKEFERIYEAFAAGDPRRLNGEPLRGVFSDVVRVAIAGVLPPAREAISAGPVAGAVRRLVEAKSA